MTQKEFYKSQAWRRCRAAFISYRRSIDGGMCQVCGESLGLVVHHIKWLNDKNCTDPDIALNFDNLRYECQTCHNKEKDPEKTKPIRFRYAADGSILPPLKG